MFQAGRKKKHNKPPCKQKSRTGQFYQTLKKKKPKHTLNLLKKIKEEGTLSKSLYEATKTLITKPDKDTTKKEN